MDKGWRLIEGQILLAGNRERRVGWISAWKLRRAIVAYEEALKINPEGWQSMWALGKIYQRTGDDQMSLDWFSQSFEINPTQPDVAREAGLAALNTGDGVAAIRFCLAACSNNPDDPGLAANLAWAYLIGGDQEKARELARQAVSRDPDDEISRRVLKIVEEVASGSRPTPKSLLDIERRQRWFL